MDTVGEGEWDEWREWKERHTSAMSDSREELAMSLRELSPVLCDNPEG